MTDPLPAERKEPILARGGADLVGGLVGLAIAFALLVGSWYLVLAVGRWTSYEPTFTWWLGAYFVVGAVLASLTALVVFLGAWAWSADRYGGICFVFGWIPSAILAAIAWPLALFLWGPALIVLMLVNIN